jgi:hypothetical membrane protein
MEIIHRVRLGAWCLVSAVPLFIAGNVVAGLGWRRPPYSWSADNISDLGNVTCGQWDTSRPRYVCSPWHDLMNAVFIATAVLLAAGIVLAWHALEARILLLGAPIGLALAGLFPADVHLNLHVLGGALLFGVANLGLLAAAIRSGRTARSENRARSGNEARSGDMTRSWSATQSGGRDWPGGIARSSDRARFRQTALGQLRPFTLLMALVAIAGTVLFFARQGLGVGLGGMERVAAFPFFVWAMVVGAHLLRERQSNYAAVA